MKLQRKNTAWFTLIELLVVITIIGILATGATAVYTSQIQRARDSTRLTDINAIKSWVEMIYQDDAEYPDVDDEFETDIKKYVQKLPRDPKNWSTCNNQWWAEASVACAYAYAVWQDTNGIDNGSYEVSTAFENTWNIDSKALNDGWNDNVRQEIWLLMTWITPAHLDTSLLATDISEWDTVQWVCNVGTVLVVAWNTPTGWTYWTCDNS